MAELDTALDTVAGGTVIDLAAGRYAVGSTLQDRSFSPPVILLGAADHSSVLHTKITVQNTVGLVFSNLRFECDQPSTDTVYYFLQTFSGCSNIEISNCRMQTVDLDHTTQLFPYFSYIKGENWTIRNNHFTGWRSVISAEDLVNFTVVENEIVDRVVDAIFIAASLDGVYIARNTVGRVLLGSSDPHHVDAVQYTSLNCSADDVVRNVLIEDNYFETIKPVNQGQTTLIEDEYPQNGLGVGKLIENWTLRNNIYVCDGSHSISFSCSNIKDLTIENNTIINNRASGARWIEIRRSDTTVNQPPSTAENVQILNNVISDVKKTEHAASDAEFTLSGNYTGISEKWLNSSNCYNRMFINAHSDEPTVVDFLPRPGGDLYGSSVGAAALLARVPKPAYYIDDENAAGTASSDTVVIVVAEYPGGTPPSGPKTFLIEWGDGATTAASSGSHQYAAAGWYTITATITGTVSSTVAKKRIYVSAPVLYDIRFDTGSPVDHAPRVVGLSAPIQWLQWPGPTADATNAAYGSGGGYYWAELDEAVDAFLQVPLSNNYWPEMAQCTFIMECYRLGTSGFQFYKGNCLIINAGSNTAYVTISTGADKSKLINCGTMPQNEWVKIKVQFDGLDPLGPSVTVWINETQTGPTRDAINIVDTLRIGNTGFNIGCSTEASKMFTGRIGRTFIAQGLWNDFP